MKKSKLETRLEVGEEVIYFDGKTLMEITKVVSVDKETKSAMLENRVNINRQPHSKDHTYHRVERGKPGIAWKKEDALSFYEAFKAKRNIVKLAGGLLATIKVLNFLNPEEAEILNKLNSKIEKLCTLVGK